MDIYSKIIEAVEMEDCELMVNILNEIAVQTSPFQQPNQALVSAMLSIAAHQEKLDPCFSCVLIEGTAELVDSFVFLRTITYILDIEPEDIDESDVEDVLEDIKEALSSGLYDEQINIAIEELDENAFEALILFIINDVESLDVRYNTSIISHIYHLGMVSDKDLFSTMGSFIKVDNIFDEYAMRLMGGNIGSIIIAAIPLDNSKNDKSDTATS